MFGKIILTLSVLACASAQIPSLGFCPEYVPMVDFDMPKFLGVWYEAERYFQLTEVVSRCVMANYTRGPNGKYHVSNEVTNRFTGIKRILEGEIKNPPSKAEEGKLHVKYTLPLSPETKYSVLETDYDTYAVLWSCSGLGPFHTQNAWLMTRERMAPGAVLQKAYGVLDKYKISKSFFVKTDQADCAYLDTAPVAPAADKPAEVAEAPAVAPAKSKPEESVTEGAGRAALTPEEVEENALIVEVKKPVEVVPEMAAPVETVPEHILKVAEIKEEKLVEVPQEDMVAEATEEKKIDVMEEKKIDVMEEKKPEIMNEKSA